MFIWTTHAKSDRLLAQLGRQDDGADLMGLESVAQGGPGRVDRLAEQGFLDGDQQVIGEHAEEDVSLSVRR
jgi:hypothetical protein